MIRTAVFKALWASTADPVVAMFWDLIEKWLWEERGKPLVLID